MSTKIQLTEKERQYLLMLLAAEYKGKIDRQLQAASNNVGFYDSDADTVSGLLDKVKA